MKFLFVLLLGICSASGAFYVSNPVTDSLNMTDNPMISSPTNHITIAIWLSKTTNQIGTFEGTFISKGGTGFEGPYNAGQGFTNRLKFAFKSTASAFNTAWGTGDNGYTARDRIDFMVFSYTYTNTNSMRLYLNGSSLSVSILSTPTNVPPAADADPLRIGRESTGRGWGGYYSELAIWQDYLTVGQIELLRTSKIKGIALQVNPSTLKLYMPLDTIPDRVAVPASRPYVDRRNFGPFVTALGTSLGMAERICSYQPNE